MTTNNKSFFAKNSLYFFVISLVLVILTVFFSFKIFSKTTHNIKFVIQYAEDFDINPNEIADIEFLNNNNEFETLTGTTLTVEKDKSVTFRVKLNTGYKNINNLTATNIYQENINNQENIESEFVENYYQWTTDNINSDREIIINNIEPEKLSISEPVIYDLDNNILDNNLYLRNWKNYVNYNNKFEFELDLSNFEEEYKIEQVLACTELDGEISSEIYYENNLCKIELYDHDNENNYSGITSNITKLEIYLTPAHVENELVLAANGTAETNVTLTWNAVDEANPVTQIKVVGETGDGYDCKDLTPTDGKYSCEIKVNDGKAFEAEAMLTDWASYEEPGNAPLTFDQDKTTVTSITRKTVEITITWDQVNEQNPIKTIDNIDVTPLSAENGIYTKTVTVGMKLDYTPELDFQDWVDRDKYTIPGLTAEKITQNVPLNLGTIPRKTTNVNFTWQKFPNSDANPVKQIKFSAPDGKEVSGAVKENDKVGWTCELASVPVGLPVDFAIELGDYFNAETNEVDFSSGEKAITTGNLLCKLENVQENQKDIEITGYKHNDVQIQFDFPQLAENNTKLGTVTIGRSELQPENASYTVPFGCKEISVIYNAGDWYKIVVDDNREAEVTYKEGEEKKSIAGTVGLTRAEDNILTFSLDGIYFDKSMTFTLPEVDYRMCALVFTGNDISDGVILEGQTGGVSKTGWTERTEFNISSTANFSVRNNDGYTIGIMDANIQGCPQKSLPEINFNENKSTEKLTYSFELTENDLLNAYCNDGNITVTLNNIKKLHSFGLNVTGFETTDSELSKSVRTSYLNEYVVCDGNFIASDTKTDSYGATVNSAVMFIPDGAEFEYTVTLPDNHYYKFKNETEDKYRQEFRISSGYDNQKLEVMKNYFCSGFDIRRPESISDSDYENLKTQFRVYECTAQNIEENTTNKIETDVLLEDKKTLVDNTEDTMYKMGAEVSLNNGVTLIEEEGNCVILEMLIGAKKSSATSLVTYPVTDSNTTVYADVKITEIIEIKDTENMEISEIEKKGNTSDVDEEQNAVFGEVSTETSVKPNEIAYPKYFLCELKPNYTAEINNNPVTAYVTEETKDVKFAINAVPNDHEIKLNCSGKMDIYEGRTSVNQIARMDTIRETYGHTLILRFVHDINANTLDETSRFLTTLQDYFSIIETESNQPLNQGTDYSIELTNSSGIYTAIVTINQVLKDLTINFKAGTDDQQIVDFKQINGVKYIMLNKKTNEPPEYATEGVAFTENRLQIPVNSDFYFAVYTDNIAYSIDKLNVKIDVGMSKDYSDRADFEELTATSGYYYLNLDSNVITEKQPTDTITESYKCKVYKIHFKTNIAAVSTVSGNVEKIPLTIKFTDPDINTDDWNLEEDKRLLYIYNGNKINPHSSTEKENKIYYGNKLEFKVELSETCNKSDIKIFAEFYKDEKCTIPVTDSNNNPIVTELQALNGVYSYMNVTNHVVISVKNIKLNDYVLNFTPSEKIKYYTPDTTNTEIYSGSDFEGTLNIKHNGEFSFFVKANDGYDLGEQVLNLYTIEDGTKSLDELEDYKQNIKYKKFVIKNITQDMTISVKNIQDVKYNVNLIPVDGAQYFNDSGMSVSGTLKIVHGSNFEFGVSVQDAYDESIPGMFISVNNNTSSKSSAQKLSSGRYVIPNVREDINIEVKNIAKNKYIVTLENVEGAEYYSQDNKKITGDNEVAHGESLLFKVELYPAYADSKITVMCGTEELKPNGDNMYEVKNVRENLLVDIGGIDKTTVAKLIETIETLPREIITEDDVYEVVSASQTYESLSENQKSAVTNYSTLSELQEKIAPIHHEYNGVIIEGLDWHIKLIADPISTDMEVCARIYDKLSTEYIVSLYDVYLWNTLTDTRYTLPEYQTVVLKLPIPDMSYFKDPSGVHEREGEKLEFLNLTTSSEYYILETESLSPIGIIANRTNERGRSSLIDALDANINTITNYTMNLFSQQEEETQDNNSDLESENSEEQEIEIDESFFEESENSNTQEQLGKTKIGSALKLVLILLILLIIITGILIFIKNKNNK